MPDRASEVVIGFDDSEVRFRLLWDRAPRTCEAVTGALPYSGEASHATCSGPAGVAFLDRELPVAPENATTGPRAGDLLYTYYPPGWRQGYPDHTSEIYWFYPPGGRPTVPGMYVPAMASVFAEPGDDSDLQPFHRWTKSLHAEGYKPIRIEAA